MVSYLFQGKRLKIYSMTKLLPLLLILVSFSVKSQDYIKISDPSSSKNKLEKKSNTTKTISAKFKETIYSSMFNNPKEGSGFFIYKNDGNIRWEKKTPSSNIILINNGTLKMKQDGEVVSNITSNKLAKRIQSLMVTLINSEFLTEKEFSIDYYQTSQKYKLVLTPKNSRLKKYISNIELVFNKSNLALDKMSMFETEDDYVEYTFSVVLFNKTISDSQFTKF